MTDPTDDPTGDDGRGGPLRGMARWLVALLERLRSSTDHVPPPAVPPPEPVPPEPGRAPETAGETAPRSHRDIADRRWIIELRPEVQADVELVLCGLGLPAVPLSEVVHSYFYDLLPDGRWVLDSAQAVLRVEVTPDAVRMRTSGDDVHVDRQGPDGARHTVRPTRGELLDLVDHDVIHSPAGTVRFVALAGPYAGLLLRDTDLRLGLLVGQTAELGREPSHPGLAFPDRRGQHHLSWCPGPRAARARAHGFTLDRALVGRRQASLTVGPNGTFTVTHLHPRCSTWVLRHAPEALVRVEGSVQVQLVDLLVAGTSVVRLAPAPEGVVALLAP